MADGLLDDDIIEARAGGAKRPGMSASVFQAVLSERMQAIEKEQERQGAELSSMRTSMADLSANVTRFGADLAETRGAVSSLNLRVADMSVQLAALPQLTAGVAALHEQLATGLTEMRRQFDRHADQHREDVRGQHREEKSSESRISRLEARLAESRRDGWVAFGAAIVTAVAALVAQLLGVSLPIR